MKGATMPERIQWLRFNGPLPANARLVTRSSRYGNPLPVCEHRTRAEAVDQFERLLASPGRAVDPSWLCGCSPERQLERARRYPTAAQIRQDLAGYDLACACDKNGPCHATALLAVANGGR
jgi:hypothetical protein